MSSLWLPLRWFIQLFELVIDFEPFPGLSFGSISLGFLTIILIFRMIIFPLTGGSISSAISNISSGLRSPRSDGRAHSRTKEKK